MTNEKKMPRRNFIKYAAGAAVVVVAGAAATYFVTQPGAPPTGTTTAVLPTTTEVLPATTAAKVYKAAGLFFGIVTDQAWNTVGWDAMNGLKDKLGWEIANSEQIYSPDAERVMREYVTNGFDFIIPWSGEYYNDVVKAAPSFPETSLLNFAMGGWPPPNLADLPPNIQWVDSQQHPGFYATGALAALMSKTKKIGHVGAMAYDTSIASVNAYKQGALSVESDTEVYKLWTGSWDDATKAKEATISLFEKGVDVVQHQADLGSFGVFEAVKEYNQQGKTVWAIGLDRDQAYLAPGYVLTSALTDYNSALVAMGKDIMNGNLGGVQHVTIEAGRLSLAPFDSKVPDEVKTKVNEIFQKLVSGQIVVPLDTNESW
jgi:basic membrane protein A